MYHVKSSKMNVWSEVTSLRQDKRFLYVVMERVKGGELFEVPEGGLFWGTLLDFSCTSSACIMMYPVVSQNVAFNKKRVRLESTDSPGFEVWAGCHHWTGRGQGWSSAHEGRQLWHVYIILSM